MSNDLMKLNELIPQLKFCNYENEASKLECNVAFRQISKIIERLDHSLENIIKDESNLVDYTDEEFRRYYKLKKQLNFIITGTYDDVEANKIFEQMGYKVDSCEPSPEKCEDCEHLNYDVDDGIYSNFYCDKLDRSLDDELLGRVFR